MTSLRALLGRKTRASSTSPASEPAKRDTKISGGFDSDIRMIGRPFDAGMQRALASGYMIPSFSQLGEDATLRWLFGNRTKGYYVDVGCHYPFHHSNTAVLHVWLGWSGINIDIDKKAIDAFDLARPGDTNIHSAVGSRKSRVQCAIYDDKYQSTISTILPDFRRDLPHEIREIEMSPLADLLDSYLPEGQTIDFLNVDAEGCDFDVLSSNDWSRYQPKAVAVEMPGQSVREAMASQTYALLIA